MQIPETAREGPGPIAHQHPSANATREAAGTTGEMKAGPAPPTPRRAGRRVTWLFGLALFLMPLGYALYTGEIWEDFFITFRFSRNLALGNGLVFQPGERVYGFTSPLNTLLPALFDWLGGSRSYEASLWAYRVASAAAFAAAGLLLTTLLRRESRPGDPAPWLFALLLLFDLKAVAFSANGQEAAFMLLFLALGFHCVYRGPAENWRLLGVSGGGLLWTRPDGCVYAAILSLAGLLFGAAPARKQFLGLARAAAVCAVLYLPLFLTVWFYFGTPVPHTIVAKSIGRPDAPTGITLVKVVLAGVVDAASLTAAPVYANPSDWPSWVNALCLAMGLASAAYWLIPSDDRLGRMASFAYLLGCLYISLYTATSYNGSPFPWYLPAVNLFGLVALARAPATVLAKWRRARPSTGLAWPAGAGLVAGTAGIFLMGCYQIRVHQREIEWGVRARVGLWLAENVAPSETVYSESLGYFGFFGQRHMLDWPGLVSPRVVETRRKGNNHLIQAMAALQPDWIVVRPDEMASAMQHPEIRSHYKVAKIFRTSRGLSDYASLPGIGYLKVDEVFVVLERRREPVSARPAGFTP
jgi:hypothetical protein